MTDISTIPTVRDLRRRWKPHKERLAASGAEQPTSIRFHRACSWMARVEQMPDDQDHDLGLVSLWNLRTDATRAGVRGANWSILRGLRCDGGAADRKDLR